MKNSFIFTAATLLLFSCNNVQSRNNNTQDSNNVKEQHIDNMQGNDVQEQNVDATIIDMLHDFYTAYAKIWSEGTAKDFNVVKSQCDSLATIYCTNKMRLSAKEALNDVGVDVLTGELWIDNESLKSMKITKDSTKNDCYIVSYNTIESPMSSEPPVMYNVTLYVDVVKVDEQYKISWVKGDSVPIDE